MNLANLIELARQHMNNDVAMRSSAQSCYNDAVITAARAPNSVSPKHMEESARMWALKSLQYSIGILTPAYQIATAEFCEVYNSETGEVVHDADEKFDAAGTPSYERLTYERAVSVAADWNTHAENLFRVRPFTASACKP